MMPAPMTPRFLIATSCRNATRYIDETVASIAMQRGDFTVHYHVQDAGSTDGTLERLAAWQGQIERGGFPTGCRAFAFSFDSAPDTGLYEGLNRAFARLTADADGSELMGWLNASDRYLPGAFQTVADVAAEMPGTAWLTGLPATITDDGSARNFAANAVYPAKCLVAGLHDGRHMKQFVQQEGTFWRTHLWRRAGMLDPALRLTGDFDLWRRFAALSPLLAVQLHLGQFRFHRDRMSLSIAAYYEELDRLDGGRLALARQNAWATFKELKKEGPAALLDHGFGGPVLARNPNTETWEPGIEIPETIEYERPAPTRIDRALKAIGLVRIGRENIVSSERQRT